MKASTANQKDEQMYGLQNHTNKIIVKSTGVFKVVSILVCMHAAFLKALNKID